MCIKRSPTMLGERRLKGCRRMKASVLPALPPRQLSVKHSTPLASLVLTASPGVIQELRMPALPLWDFCRCAVTWSRNCSFQPVGGEAGRVSSGWSTLRRPPSFFCFSVKFPVSLSPVLVSKQFQESRGATTDVKCSASEKSTDL